MCLSKDQSHVLSIINQPTKLCNFVLLLPVPALHYGVGYSMWKIDLLSSDLRCQRPPLPVYKVLHWLEELFLVDSSSFCWLFASEVGLRIVLQKGGVTKREKKAWRPLKRTSGLTLLMQYQEANWAWSSHLEQQFQVVQQRIQQGNRKCLQILLRWVIIKSFTPKWRLYSSGRNIRKGNEIRLAGCN